MRRVAVFSVLLIAIAAIPRAQAPVEKLDYETIGKIRDEGLNRSQVMDHISWLADVRRSTSSSRPKASLHSSTAGATATWRRPGAG